MVAPAHPDPAPAASRRGALPARVIEARGLGRRYGDRAALIGLDLDVRGGEVFGLLGSDGAGKT
ncbi:MAG TPA: hypothetical protein VHN38_09065, partial [Immundisolibacter sp.]|nr:hypothetical protein [Immundisolibacter sp.]